MKNTDENKKIEKVRKLLRKRIKKDPESFGLKVKLKLKEKKNG